MLGPSWLDDSIADEQYPTPIRAGEPTTIVSTVQGFLRNDAGFSRSDVEEYVNSALQNEAAELMHNRIVFRDTAETWGNHIEALRSREADPVEVAEVEQARTAFLQSSNQEYEQGVLGFADAVVEARGSNKVRLDPETCRLVVELDRDGLVGTQTGLDVKAVFGANEAYAGPVHVIRELKGSSPSAAAPSLAVDFSRQGAPAPGAEPAPTLEQTAPGIAPARVPATKGVVPSPIVRSQPARRPRFEPTGDGPQAPASDEAHHGLG